MHLKVDKFEVQLHPPVGEKELEVLKPARYSCESVRIENICGLDMHVFTFMSLIDAIEFCNLACEKPCFVNTDKQTYASLARIVPIAEELSTSNGAALYVYETSGNTKQSKHLVRHQGRLLDTFDYDHVVKMYPEIDFFTNQPDVSNIGTRITLRVPIGEKEEDHYIQKIHNDVVGIGVPYIPILSPYSQSHSEYSFDIKGLFISEEEAQKESGIQALYSTALRLDKRNENMLSPFVNQYNSEHKQKNERMWFM